MDTSAKFLVESLVNQGINTYFGIPGGPVSPLFDAVLRTTGTTLVESKHETAAVFDGNNSNIDLYSRAGFQSEANDPFMGTKERRIAESHIPY